MSAPKPWFLLAAVLVAVTGCSPAGEAAPPTRTSTTTRTSSPTSHSTIAPTVTRTLDLASYRSRPCELLTPEQQSFFNRPGVPNRDLAAYCKWSRDQTRSGLDVLLQIDSDLFREIFQPGYYKKWLIFEQRTIAGQPAVVASDSPDPRYCDVVVATGPKDSFEVHQDSGIIDEDSCVRAVEWAERVVRNLGG
jgi:hypothetical protein